MPSGQRRRGFGLAPYKVIKGHLDVDVEGYRPRPGEIDQQSREIDDRLYNQKDFDPNLVIDACTQRVAQWVSDHLKHSGNRFRKTIVFCVDTEHAARMHQAFINENQDIAHQNPRYVMRSTGDAQRLSQLCWMFFPKIIDDQNQQFKVMQDLYRWPIPESLQWRTWAADPESITGEALLAFIKIELFPALKELPITGANANHSRVVRSVFEDAYNDMKSGQLMRQVINKISSTAPVRAGRRV